MPYYSTSNFDIVATSLKVMSSSLNKTKGLKRLRSYEIPFYLLLNRIKGANSYFILRNPVDRVVSVYKSKIFNATDYRTNGLQNIHKNFLKVLEMENEGLDNSINALQQISVSDYLEILKSVYQNDPHTWPQNRLGKIFMFNYKPKHFVRMDDKIEMEALQKNLSIEFIHTNKTKTKMPVEINAAQKALIQELYKEDFRLYNQGDGTKD